MTPKKFEIPNPTVKKATKPLTRLFASCTSDPSSEFEPVRRSVRIHGHSTTIRLEHAFWTVLQELAEMEEMTLAAMITAIQDHCHTTDQSNLASCLRVVCLKYMEMPDGD